jgi:hypothetical protein
MPPYLRAILTCSHCSAVPIAPPLPNRARPRPRSLGVAKCSRAGPRFIFLLGQCASNYQRSPVKCGLRPARYPKGIFAPPNRYYLQTYYRATKLIVNPSFFYDSFFYTTTSAWKRRCPSFSFASLCVPLRDASQDTASQALTARAKLPGGTQRVGLTWNQSPGYAQRHGLSSRHYNLDRMQRPAT